MAFDRRRDLQHLVGIDVLTDVLTDMFTDVERRADELNRGAAELLDGWL